MSQAQATSGSATAAAAVPATSQAPPPSTAAPAQTPVANIAPALVARKQRNFAPAKNIPDSTASASGLSQMLDAVSNIGYTTNRDLRVPNYVVPCFIMFFQIVGIMDTQMAHTKRYIDANPDWHPHVSQLYFSILVFYFVLTAQSAGNQISQEQRLFLEFLEQQFNVKSAKIPGPLVPFFQSLAACSGPDAAYGNVTFGIPTALNVRQNQHFLANNRYNAHLPSVIFVLDQFMRLINRFAPVGAAPAAVALDVTDSHYMDIYGTIAAPGAANSVCMKTPTARAEINVSLSGMQGFFGTTNLWRAVLPFDPATNQSTYVAGANANALNFAQVLGFEGFGPTTGQYYNWFNEVGRIMQPYSDFFRDSVSLGSINTTGIGAVFVRTELSMTLANVQRLTAAMATRNVRYRAAAAVRYDVPNLVDLETQHSYAEDYLEIVTEQLGTLTQLHVVWTINGAIGTVFPGPMTGNVEIGPVWNRPWRMQTPIVSVSRYVGNLISGYYHTPTAGKFGN